MAILGKRSSVVPGSQASAENPGQTRSGKGYRHKSFETGKDAEPPIDLKCEKVCWVADDDGSEGKSLSKPLSLRKYAKKRNKTAENHFSNAGPVDNDFCARFLHDLVEDFLPSITKLAAEVEKDPSTVRDLKKNLHWRLPR